MLTAESAIFENPADTLFSLRDITASPKDMSDPLFSHYPAMKLGGMGEVRFYAQQLATLVETQIQKGDLNKTAQGQDKAQLDWMVTAPASSYLPSAANLLAHSVWEKLNEKGYSTLLFQPKLISQVDEFKSKAEFERYFNYSQQSLSERIEERARVQKALSVETLQNAVEGKRLLIINDIYVTGTQQHFMQQAFDAAGAKQCYWFYIFKLAANLAVTSPETEFNINTSKLNALSDYVNALSREDICYTARCLSRLFNETQTTFNEILAALSPAVCDRIWRHAKEEPRYQSQLFHHKLALLARAAKGIVDKSDAGLQGKTGEGETHVRY